VSPRTSTATATAPDGVSPGADAADSCDSSGAGGPDAASPRDGSEPSWRALVAPYRRSDDRIATRQLLTTVPPYLGLLVAMFLSLRGPYALTLLLAVPAAAFLARTFVLFHDCGHDSLFSRRRANDAAGLALSLLVWEAFHYWRHIHAVHHATSSHLDRRGTGDYDTLTVREYLALPRGRAGASERLTGDDDAGELSQLAGTGLDARRKTDDNYGLSNVRCSTDRELTAVQIGSLTGRRREAFSRYRIEHGSADKHSAAVGHKVAARSDRTQRGRSRVWGS
jgi:hypothetical protein